jgi:ABC-2 type transport system permease protein
MRKYLRMLLGFFKASAMADLEYRLNFVVKVGTDIIWYTAQLSVFEVLFSHTRSISGWTLESMRVFMGVLFVTDALWMMLFSENLDRLSDKVRRGDLDLLLVKPVNSQFMMSLQRMNPAYLLNFFLVLIWLLWSLVQLPDPIHWGRVLLLIITVPCSLAISYSMRFFFSATALIFTRAENINYVWYQIYRLGTRPDTIYPSWLRYTVLTIVPVGFLASVPARLILSTPDLPLLTASVGLAIFLVYLSTRYWKFALKFYSSASS